MPLNDSVTRVSRRIYSCTLKLDKQCLDEEDCPCIRLISKLDRMPIDFCTEDLEYTSEEEEC